VNATVLVQENNRYTASVPVTVGTNVFKQISAFDLTATMVHPEAIHMRAHVLDMSENGKCGSVRVKKPTMIPANS
jgi:hypothetical protein